MAVPVAIVLSIMKASSPPSSSSPPGVPFSASPSSGRRQRTRCFCLEVSSSPPPTLFCPKDAAAEGSGGGGGVEGGEGGGGGRVVGGFCFGFALGIAGGKRDAFVTATWKKISGERSDNGAEDVAYEAAFTPEDGIRGAGTGTSAAVPNAAETSNGPTIMEGDALETLSNVLREVVVGLIDGRGGGTDDEGGGAGGPSTALLRKLLAEADLSEEVALSGDGTGDATLDGSNCENDETENIEAGRDKWSLHVRLRGLPRRPYYRELSRRLLIVSLHRPPLPPSDEWFVPASEMGMAELSPLPAIPLPSPSLSSDPDLASSLRSWLRAAGADGVLRLLGLRRTVGTVPGLLPPDASTLVSSARRPCKPDAKAPHLSVAARARAKHAHRGSSGFFGAVRGGAGGQNVEAEAILWKILREAVWINLHVFAGTEDRPVLEVRVADGYGARWALPRRVLPRETSETRQDKDSGCVCGDVVGSSDERKDGEEDRIAFRGFLEPQMEGGHERRWRH